MYDGEERQPALRSLINKLLIEEPTVKANQTAGKKKQDKEKEGEAGANKKDRAKCTYAECATPTPAG